MNYLEEVDIEKITEILKDRFRVQKEQFNATGLTNHIIFSILRNNGVPNEFCWDVLRLLIDIGFIEPIVNQNNDSFGMRLK